MKTASKSPKSEARWHSGLSGFCFRMMDVWPKGKRLWFRANLAKQGLSLQKQPQQNHETLSINKAPNYNYLQLTTVIPTGGITGLRHKTSNGRRNNQNALVRMLFGGFGVHTKHNRTPGLERHFWTSPKPTVNIQLQWSSNPRACSDLWFWQWHVGRWGDASCSRRGSFWHGERGRLGCGKLGVEYEHELWILGKQQPCPKDHTVLLLFCRIFFGGKKVFVQQSPFCFWCKKKPKSSPRSRAPLPAQLAGLDSEKTEELCAKASELSGKRRSEDRAG